MKYINTKNAPEPIGPYSQAIESNGFIFTSGQIAINPKNSQLIENDVEQQTHQVIKNLREVLKSSGSDLNKVIKTTIFIKDMNDFFAVNKVYEEYFGESQPARSTVEVSRLPKDVLIEIDCIAEK